MNTTKLNTTKRQIECTIPILPVGNLERSIEFYTGTLGFKLDWGGGDGSTLCSVSKDGCAIMLNESPTGAPSVWVWIGLEDDSLFHLWRSCGVKVRQEPKNFSWAYEMKFEDIDGNVLWLGTEPRKDMPFEDQNNWNATSGAQNETVDSPPPLHDQKTCRSSLEPPSPKKSSKNAAATSRNSPR